MTLVRVALVCLAWLAVPAFAIDTTVLPNPELQARYENLTHELRCMQCMNNNIADSPVGLAADLRREVAEMLTAGKSDDEIRAYMVDRYGEVILFNPPLNAGTAWVWAAPLLALVGGLIIAFVIVRRRGRLVATDDSDVRDDAAP